MDNIIIYNTDDGAASVKLYADDLAELEREIPAIKHRKQ